MKQLRHQSVTDKYASRTLHIWRKKDGLYKCVLCGAVCQWPPPPVEPEGWEPLRYEPLTDEDRALSPKTAGELV
jgi:hypothetical protein